MPDIIIQPNQVMIYAEPADRLIEEPGGFTDDDTHVALLMSLPGIPPQQIKSFVRTAQITPTILSQIGLDPRSLQSVVKGYTPLLLGWEVTLSPHR
jgi:hypothetical protein